MARTFSAVVLAGGTGARLDGVDKSSLEHDGRTLLDHCLDALTDADVVVVVGTEVPTSRPVTFTREHPASGGPAAGLLAGVEALGVVPDLLGVLAVDMPHVTAATFRRLREAVAEHDGAFLTDQGGRRQLAGVVVTARLEERGSQVAPRPEDRSGLPLRVLLDGLYLALLDPVGREAADIDTWADVHDLRASP